MPRYRLGIALLSVSLGIITAGCNRSVLRPPSEEIAPAVIVIEAKRETSVSALSLKGLVVANQEIEVRARIGGEVAKILFEEGKQVRAGDPLYEVVTTDTDAAAPPKPSSMPEVEDGSGTIAQTEVPIASAKAQPASHAAVVTAPCVGQMGRRLVDTGRIVAAGQLLTTIIQIDPAILEIRVSEFLLTRLSVGQAVTVRVPAYPAEIFSGEISFIAPQVDPMRRTLMVKASVPNPDQRLKSGMAATLEVEPGPGVEALWIPEIALIRTSDRLEVLVVNDSGIAESRIVRLGARRGGRVEILEGLRDCEHVIVEGWQSTRPGIKVAARFVSKAAPHPWSGTAEGEPPK